MDELKLLVEMVSHLPTMAVWVIAFFFAYKVICVGSVYGVIRFGIAKLHSWLTTPKHTLQRTDVEIRGLLDGICITKEVDGLMSQVRRLCGKGVLSGSEYIHRCSVEWLREAIDDKIAKDAAEERARAELIRSKAAA